MNIRKERGITLIALIITIIVMIILVGVTINIAINGGLLGKAEKATFQTQVRQIQEALQIKKAILLADDLGTLENINDITLDDLDIDAKLKTKFAQKFIISKESDDFMLCYNSEKVTRQEIEWLEELGIEEKQIIAQTDFETDVKIIAEKNKYAQIYDTYSIYQQVKTAHPTAAIIPIYMPEFINVTYPVPLLASYDRSEFVHNILETISMLKEKYSNSENVPITDEINAEVRRSLAAEDIESNPNSLFIIETNEFIENSSTVADLITQMNTYIEEDNKSDYYLAVKDEQQLLIHNSRIIDYSCPYEEYIILSGKAAKDYEYEVVKSFEEFKLSTINITKYKGTESQIKVPFMIITEEGETLMVSKIKSNAFANTKPVRLEVGSTFMQYVLLLGNRVKTSYDDLTTIDFAKNFGVSLDENGTYTNTRQEKNEFILNTFANMIPEGDNIQDYYEAQGEGNEQRMYIYTSTLKHLPPTCHKTDVEYVEPIQSIVFSEGIEDIEANAMSGNWFLEVYIPTTFGDVSTEAFVGAGISNIRTRMAESELKALNGNSEKNILGSSFYAEDCEFIPN